MSLPTISETKSPAIRRELRLVWLGSAASCVWFASLVCLYALSDHECGSARAWRSWGLWSAALVSGAAITLRCLQLSRSGGFDRGAPRARTRFMLNVGLGLNLLSLALLLGFAVPLALLRPCE